MRMHVMWFYPRMLIWKYQKIILVYLRIKKKIVAKRSEAQVTLFGAHTALLRAKIALAHAAC